MALLEREESLKALSRALDASRTGGQLVSVCGEAGIGKSALVKVFAAAAGSTGRCLYGYCEALGTPRPLGPLLDIAADLGGRTASALGAAAPRHEIFTAFITDLRGSHPAPIAIFEDVHWADEATLDLLQFVARRLDYTRSVVVISWRDDAVNADHRIHRVLSSCPQAVVHRIRLEPLTVDAVGRLTPEGRDPLAVHALTGGNPFFVTELATAASGAVPASVRDAVLARRGLLDTHARAILDLVSVVPLRAEIPLVEAAMADAAAGLEACVTAGLLGSDARSVWFRHELARLAVFDALPGPRAQDCHRRVLGVLLSHPDRERNLARIVHHAEACGAIDAVVEHAPAAARQASAVGAHRQAVDHYRRTLHYADRVALPARVLLNEAFSYELYLTDDIANARTVRHEALTLSRRLGDAAAVGRNTRWLSRIAWFEGDRQAADRHAVDAIEVLSALPASEELAMAFSNRAQLYMLHGDLNQCLEWGAKAIELARTLDAHEVLAHALNNVGTVRCFSGDLQGRARLVESLEIALRHDLHEHATRAYTNLASAAVERRDYHDAGAWLDAGMAYTSEREMEPLTVYMRAYRARVHAETGRWQSACEDAEAIVGMPQVAAVSRIPALATLGLVRVRRGDPDAESLLDDALGLARRTGESQRLAPVQLARAEMAMLAGRRDEAVSAIREALDSFAEHADPLRREPLWYWLWRADALDVRQISGEGPFVSLIRGDWRAAADQWRRIGCPYERALCLAEGDETAARAALDIFKLLGAAPAVDWVRQRLRHAGVVTVPRGRRAATLAHPAGLTARESEILDLLALGLLNTQIADRLFVSVKTVEHHVSSILAKLDVSSRDAAVARARGQGWVKERGRDPSKGIRNEK